ncbi:hypothetical protein [Epilithonimonas xixisoli]|uniref:Lipocalin-like protein n=1 Tax=Epilithonimonas xixisoli TaxID=1476462 RepID=A0A4V3H302_9FLAO|nr:hypothetical protein [Epilithonimonas xixisoli]TDX87041.1 hypothetical protein B0I22_1211 [Epilithonimonas xixisoli]
MIKFLKKIFSSRNVIVEQSLLGNWKAIEFNDQKIEKVGFIDVNLNFQKEFVEIDTKLNSFGGLVETNSSGNWNLFGSILKTNFGESSAQSEVQFLDSNTIIFTPDPFFNSETVPFSKYVRDQN